MFGRLRACRATVRFDPEGRAPRWARAFNPRDRALNRWQVADVACLGIASQKTGANLRYPVLIRRPILTAVRTIALFEAAKGLLVLVAGLGLLSLINRDVEAIAESVVRHSHLNPASHYPKIFLQAAANVTDTHLLLMAGAAALYALVRAVEAYGLWFERRWAEWFALLAGGVFIPVEIYELFHHATWLKVAIFITNVAIVAYMAYILLHPAKQARELEDTPAL